MSSSWEAEGKVKSVLKEFTSFTKSISSYRVSSSRLKAVVSLAQANTHEYKRMVHAIEKWIWANDNKNVPLTGLSIIDAIVTSKSIKKNPYPKRFLTRMSQTFDLLKSSSFSKDSITKIVSDWIKKRIYTRDELKFCKEFLPKSSTSSSTTGGGGLLPDPVKKDASSDQRRSSPPRRNSDDRDRKKPRTSTSSRWESRHDDKSERNYRNESASRSSSTRYDNDDRYDRRRNDEYSDRNYDDSRRSDSRNEYDSQRRNDSRKNDNDSRRNNTKERAAVLEEEDTAVVEQQPPKKTEDKAPTPEFTLDYSDEDDD